MALHYADNVCTHLQELVIYFQQLFRIFATNCILESLFFLDVYFNFTKLLHCNSLIPKPDSKSHSNAGGNKQQTLRNPNSRKVLNFSSVLNIDQSIKRKGKIPHNRNAAGKKASLFFLLEAASSITEEPNSLAKLSSLFLMLKCDAALSSLRESCEFILLLLAQILGHIRQ